jgi:uncharacterized protein YtpQ (UPF0354 family)
MEGGTVSEPQAPGPEGFATHVERIFKARWPERSVEIAGPMDLVVQGRHLGLENLWRIVSREPERQDEIITHYFEKLLEGDEIGNTHMPFRLVKPRIMPRIQPVGIFEHLDRDQVAHVPFVNDTVIVFVMDLPEVTVSVTVEQMVRWGVQSEDLEQISRENLSRYRPDLQVRVVESETGGRAAILSVLDGYDAARLLLETLHSTLAPQLKGDFFVATPARDMFVAISRDPEDFVGKVQRRVVRDFNRLPYPITDALFIVTRDGVAGTREAA